MAVDVDAGARTDDSAPPPSFQTATTRQPVLGGRDAAPCEWPSAVSVGGCSGVLVSPRLVVYAAHCGDAVEEVRFGTDAARPELSARTELCRLMPGARLGNGSDIAYCVLEQPVTQIQPARILAGCELDQLVEGAAVSMVGFGADGPDGERGTQRVGISRIASVGDELLLDSATVDTCHGDSGGPLFLHFAEADGTFTPRLVGITSAGSGEQCGSGVSHYTNLARKVEWLEESSNVDVTPCFRGSAWRPTPACSALPTLATDAEQGTARDTDSADCGIEGMGQALNTCGDPFQETPDDVAPRLRVVSPSRRRIARILEGADEYTEFALEATSTDSGWGVHGVEFALRDESGTVVFTRFDEVPPYAITPFRVPQGHYTLGIQARDFAGNSTSEEIEIRVSRPEPARGVPSCGASQSPAQPFGWWNIAVVVLASALLRRRPADGHAAQPLPRR